MEIAIKAYGETHPRVATVYRNQGRLEELKRDYPAAEASYRRALDIFQRLKQTRGSGTASVLVSYAQLELDRGDLAAAESKAREGLDIFEGVAGRDSSPVANSLIEAGLARELAGDAAAAEPLFRRALDIRHAKAGPDAPITIAAQVRLGEALVEEGKTAQAEPLLRDAVAFTRRSAAALLPWQRAEAESALGACLTALGQLPEAEKLFANRFVNHPRAWWSRVAAKRWDKLQGAQKTSASR
jgi:tetratricopeptide (TPR) repeat protein